MNEDSRNDTMESEHLDSDYTKCPVFPSEVYGSRPRVDSANKEGIYTRKSTVAPKKPEKVHFREDNKMLDLLYKEEYKTILKSQRCIL